MNYRHGFCQTSEQREQLTYFAWVNLKRKSGGVCLSWRKFENFLQDMNLKPSLDHWLFRNNFYQRSCKNNVRWQLYKRQLQPIWNYLPPKEIEKCIFHIRVIVRRGNYDLDEAINELYKQKLEGVKNPVARIHSWIKRYLPKDLAILKKQRGEELLNEKFIQGRN